MITCSNCQRNFHSHWIGDDGLCNGCRNPDLIVEAVIEVKTQLSFDGKGISDLETEYGPRIATFTSSEYADKFGKLFAVAPELLAFVETVVKEQMEADCGDAEYISKGKQLINKIKNNS